MPENEESDKITPISGDKLFMENFPVHPLVALFIALPIENTGGDAELYSRKPDRNAMIRAVPVLTNSQKFKIAGLPEGMAGRRVFLYFFSEFYRDSEFVFQQNMDKKEFINLFGYDVTRCRKLHPLRLNFYRTMSTEVKFFDDKDNAKVGYTSVIQDCASMFDAVWRQGGVWTVKLNPEFIFKMAFPVDFKHVTGTKKKSSFWNIYMFLIDVLPRIEKGKTKRISWELMHDVFHRHYDTVANFKYFFIQTLPEVLEIYPQAKRRVNTTDSKDLVLRYAPSPV